MMKKNDMQITNLNLNCDNVLLSKCSCVHALLHFYSSIMNTCTHNNGDNNGDRSTYVNMSSRSTIESE